MILSVITTKNSEVNMFCQKCGAQLSDNDKFCKVCGNTAAAQVNNNAGELGELDRMISYFGVKQAGYDEYDQCVTNIRYLNNPRNKIKVNAGISGLPFIIIGAVLAPEFLTFFAICLFGYGWVKADSPGHQVDNTAAIGFFSIAILGTLLSIASIVFGIILSKKRKKKYNAAKTSMYKQNIDKSVMLNNELADYYRQYGPCKISSLYSNPRILFRIREMLASGSALTIGDAVNLMHQYSGKSPEQMQSEMPVQPVSFFTADSFNPAGYAQ